MSAHNTWTEAHRDDLRQAAREMNEIIHSAPLPRMRDEDGTEWVDRDALAVEVRQHFLRRIRLVDGPGR